MSDSQAVKLFVHVEEPSMKEAMEILLPRLLRDRQANFRVIDHGSKQALLTNLPARLRGYAQWPAPRIRILVTIDRDDDDCTALKARLEHLAQAAGLPSKSTPGPDGRFRVVNRIVIEELESWFLGDISALRSAYPRVPATLGHRKTYRDPDAIKGGTWEALHRVLKASGHYAASGHLPKIDVARRVTRYMLPERNKSRSFQAFVGGLEALLS